MENLADRLYIQRPGDGDYVAEVMTDGVGRSIVLQVVIDPRLPTELSDP